MTPREGSFFSLAMDGGCSWPQRAPNQRLYKAQTPRSRRNHPESPSSTVISPSKVG
jgi:hypothetical protein